MFSGIWLPIVTPLRNGEVDIDSLQRLAEYYLRTEISGIVALSTTGEAALLEEAERLTVLQALTEVTGSRLPMLIGVGGSNTRDVLRDIQRYERWECAGYLVSAPSYVCPDQAGVQWHFEQAALATERPIVLYNVPHRTGVTIAPDTVARLVECGNIVAIKECVKEHFAKLSALPINVLCGTDEALDDCLHHGGTGGILASAHVCADLLVTFQDLLRAERDVDARNLFACLLPVLRLLFAAPNPSAIKAMLAFDHSLSDETRMPISRASAQLVERLSTARDRLQDLRAEYAGVMN
ncbi:4-hydroxy-tetrahydrodipicolinate synthase [Paraburkholderia sp. FT54]|jgi:4-hydroxy-tetrahydrodipicolinate synthase|uniref:4-hydroxy-tetrahydrodipicolinate synthase family protein n=1 Tax=Paraburkholderia sp. FT54 TaxID=3074437 RepID=UPI0028780DD3|nr:4-hydroxy-tetrahydrodipicolinate synthase [Paraburkholderia sp. FT54]WNC93036.1 4-hydroxy-tetrahydrodipicolinate synthase [Paraburkholderia sp. FT54]